MVFAETEKELFDKGVLSFKKNQYQDAIDEFSKLIELAPDNPDAYKNRGVSYMKQDQYDLAIKDFETAKNLFPELKGLYSNLGVAWYYKKEYEKAIQNYDLEIEMAPDNHVVYFNRALCLAELDRNEEALLDLEKTLRLKPDFYWGLCYKADLLDQAGKNSEAITVYEEAIQIDPDNTYATEKIAQLKKKGKKSGITIAPHPGDDIQAKDAIQKGYAIQSGAFRNQTNAGNLKNRLIQNGFDSRVLVIKDSNDNTWYLVRSGHYPDKNQAHKAVVSLKEKLGITSVVRPYGVW